MLIWGYLYYFEGIIYMVVYINDIGDLFRLKRECYFGVV